MEYYEKKEKQIEQNKKIQMSTDESSEAQNCQTERWMILLQI